MRLITNRVKSVFDQYELLSPNQYGFRKNKNTELAGITLVNRLLPALENKSYAICVFLDFTACFDTLDRNILFSKLYKYGIRGVALDLIKSYFSDRNQAVHIENSISNIDEQKLGVIQGSKSGPLFFDIYSNDLNYICENDENIMFADDTCLTYVHENLQILESHVNSRLAKILDWCRFNKLSLNPTKFEF